MRLFLAAPIPDELRGRLRQWRARLEPRLSGWRWVRVDGIHLTLRFLGEVSSDTDFAARAAWSAVASRNAPFTLQARGTGAFPAGGRPRVLWVGVESADGSDSLARLAEELEDAARRQGFAAEQRPFRPHLTLARARRGERPAGPAEADRFDGGEPFVVDRFELVRSELRREGARYSCQESFLLGQSGAGSARRA